MKATPWSRWTKLGVVVGGYVLAFLVSSVAVAIYDRRFTAEDNQMMGGMIAGGEMIYFMCLFLLLSLPPTALVLWFLRPRRRIWAAFTATALALTVAVVADFLLPRLRF